MTTTKIKAEIERATRELRIARRAADAEGSTRCAAIVAKLRELDAAYRDALYRELGL